jgi:hypothetical protein
LYGRNPRHAKSRPSESVATRWLGWTVNASIAKNMHAIAASVAARPSMLSSRLNAFVIPTIQRTPIAVATIPFETISTRTPETSTIAAAAICAKTFAMGERPKMSSTSPAAKMSAQPARMPPSSRLAGISPAARAIPTATRMPARKPLPPSRGVEVVCQRSARGAATTCRAAGVCSSAQIVSTLAGRAANAAAATVTAQHASAAGLVRLVARGPA